MVKYAAFLRGISIGSRKVTMQELQRVFKSLGLNKVKTFIASGNVSFETDDSDSVTLTRIIEQRRKARFGFAIAPMLRKIAYLLALTQEFPPPISPFCATPYAECRRCGSIPLPPGYQCGTLW